MIRSRWRAPSSICWQMRHSARASCSLPMGAISLLTVGIPHQGRRLAVGRLAIYPSHSEKEFRLVGPPKDGNPAISFRNYGDRNYGDSAC